MRYALAMSTLHPIPAAEVARVAELQRELDRLGWRKQVEDFMTASGTRCLLDHVTDEQWDAHYAANDDAYASVVLELEKVEG